MRNIAQHEHAQERGIEIWWKIQSSYNELVKLLTFSTKIHRLWLRDLRFPNPNGVRDWRDHLISYSLHSPYTRHTSRRRDHQASNLEGRKIVYLSHIITSLCHLNILPRRHQQGISISMNINAEYQRQQQQQRATTMFLNINATAVCYAATHIHPHTCT